MADEDDEISRLIDDAEILYSEYEPYSAIANYCGVAHSTARAKLEEAGLKPNTEGRWPMADAIRVLCWAKDPSRQFGKALRGEGNSAVTFGGQTKLAQLAEAKADEARIRADILRAKHAKLSSELISRPAVASAAADFASLTRNAILALPLRLAAKLEGKTRTEIVEILDAEVRKLCDDLADSGETILQDAI